MLYFGLYVQLRRGSVAGYTTDESWAYGPKEGVEAFESITFFIRFIYAINFEHLLSNYIFIFLDRLSVKVIEKSQYFTPSDRILPVLSMYCLIIMILYSPFSKLSIVNDKS